MAKFCTQCGRPLSEGEVCNCMGDNNDNLQMEQDLVQSTSEQQVNETIQKTKTELNNAFTIAKSIIKCPVTGTVELTKSNTILSSIIFILLQGILTGVFVYMSIVKIADVLFGVVATTVKKNIDFNMAGSIVFAAVISVMLSVLYIAVLYVISYVKKANGVLNNYINIMGARAVYMIVINLTAIIITFVSPYLAILFQIAVGSGVSLIIIMYGLNSIMNTDENRLVIIMIIFIIAVSIIYGLVMFKVAIVNYPMIKSIQDSLKGIIASRLLKGTSGLGDIF